MKKNDVTRSKKIRMGLVSTISLLQIGIYFIGLWFYKNQPSEGLEGLGYQFTFGGIFILLGLANIIAFGEYVIWSKRSNVRLSKFIGILEIVLVVLILLAPSLGN